MGTHKEQSNSKQKIGGVLGYHGLGEWWLTTSVEALKQGWAGDWEKRIKRLSVAVKSSYPETDGFICP